MENFGRESAPVDDEYRDGLAILRASAPILAIIIATAVLYFGKEVLLPLAMASMLAVIFSPVADRVERILGRLAGTALVVVTAIAVVISIAYFLTTELTSVADEVASYSTNIATKLTAFQKYTPPGLLRIERAIQTVQQRVQNANPAGAPRPRVVQALPVSSLSENLKPFIPVLSGVVDGLLIIVLLFFLLYSREDLRDRFVLLAARARLPVASQAIETAGEAVGRYLILFSVTNLAFGVTTGIVVWMLGLPTPELWGLLAFLFRYVPYVGALMAAILPAVVAFAVFPGWDKALEVLAAFIVLDQAAAQFIEPFLIGPGIGISPVALLISAMYWSWLWGPAGLLLATPLTACIKVAGDYIPALRFLSVLLGSEPPRENYDDYYRELLELDQEAARTTAVHYSDDHGLEATMSELIVPAVVMAAREFDQENISQDNLQLVIDTSRALVVELGNRLNKIHRVPRLRVLGVCAPGESHNLALLILLQLIRQDDVAASLVSENKSAAELNEFIRGFAPDVICLSCTMTDCLPAAAELITALMHDGPQPLIIAGGVTAVTGTDELIAAGCSQVCASIEEGRRAIRNHIWQRAKTRKGVWNFGRGSEAARRIAD